MREIWKRLKVGDRVRVVAWPKELIRNRLNVETRELYDWLIANNCVLTIVEIDSVGLPYGMIRRVDGGIEQSEYLALNHDGIEIVRVN